MNNFGKNVAPGGNTTFSPSSFTIKSVELINHRGEVYDLKFILKGFELIESLYNLSLLAKFEFSDSLNLLEELRLIGQEKIKLKLFRTSNVTEAEPQEIVHTLYVTEFPQFEKGQNENVQSYSISAVSPHVFVDKIQKISRSYNNTTTTEIKKILEIDLGVSADNIQEIGNNAITTSDVKNRVFNNFSK